MASGVIFFRRYFNPRSREGSDYNCIAVCYLSSISIHAPAKGATLFPFNRATEAAPISIHAPAKGATSPSVLERIENGISIHAPAKGATLDMVTKK